MSIPQALAEAERRVTTHLAPGETITGAKVMGSLPGSQFGDPAIIRVTSISTRGTHKQYMIRPELT